MVSVIIPIYNVEDYLEECIESVLSQTYNNYEIILVNDGSTDNSLEIAKKYYDKYSNIYLINQSNKGLSEARNVGAKNSKGEYLYFLDSDDIIYEDLLEVCINAFKNRDLDIVHFGYERLKDGEIIRKSFIESSEKILSGKEFFKYSIEKRKGKNAYVWSYIYRKEFWIDNGLSFTKDIVFEDAEIFVRILMNNPKIMLLPRHLYVYRVREGSIISKSSRSIKDIKSTNVIIKTYIEQMKKNLDLDVVFKKYIKGILRLKLSFLVEINDLEEEILDKELKSILEDKSKFNINIGSAYMERLKDIADSKNLNISTFKEEKVKRELEEFNAFRMKKMKNLDLNNSKKVVGIYGIGEHTRELLRYYEDNFQGINAQIVLIDSFMREQFNDEYNLKVININQIHEYNFDSIVISAPESENELYKNLKKYNYTGKINRFYENEDGQSLFVYF